MKRILATLISCFALLSATVSVPALAEAKDEAQESNVTALQDALTTAADGIQSVLDGMKTNMIVLFGASEQIALDNSESAEQPASFFAQDRESAAVVPSNLDGVVWSPDYTMCTLQSGANVDGQALQTEIASHKDTLTTFVADASTRLTGDASNLFVNCTSLTTVDLAGSFNTSQVTNMAYMFEKCSSLTSLTLPDAFDTSEVNSIYNMFENCSSLTPLTLPDAFDTSKVTTLYSMFDGCSSLTSLTLPDAFDTSKVTDMRYMFQDCSSLTSLTLSDAFDTSNVTRMESMFQNCSSLVSLTLPNAFAPTVTTNMNSMFSGCSSLKTLTLPSTFDPSAASEMISMFMGCSQLEKLNMPVSSSANLIACIGMFSNCDSLRELNLGNFVPPAGQASLAMFADGDAATGNISGSIPNIEKITMSGACILEPGEGTSTASASGTFFDYKEPFSWNAYYQGTTVDNEASEDEALASEWVNSISIEPTAVLTGFDEFKAYQETHPGLTTYLLNEQPTPPGPTPGPEPTPDPTPEPAPDVMPASDTGALPLTGDVSTSLSFLALTLIAGGIALAAAHILRPKRSL